jgi:hypothetical protein
MKDGCQPRPTYLQCIICWHGTPLRCFHCCCTCLREVDTGLTDFGSMFKGFLAILMAAMGLAQVGRGRVAEVLI